MKKTPKPCPRCGRIQPRSNFSGLTSAYCRPCDAEYHRERYRAKGDALWKIKKSFLALVKALAERHGVAPADIDLYAYYSDGRELMALTFESVPKTT